MCKVDRGGDILGARWGRTGIGRYDVSLVEGNVNKRKEAPATYSGLESVCRRCNSIRSFGR